MGNYVQQFTFPKSNPKVAHLFHGDKKHNNYKNERFSSNGSELLTLAPILHRYLAIVRSRGEQIAIIDSMLACLAVVMLLQALKTGTVTAATLNLAIITHLALFHNVWGDTYIRPKTPLCPASRTNVEAFWIFAGDVHT